MANKVRRYGDILNINYCRFGFYIEIDKSYFKINNFLTLYNVLHIKYKSNEEQYFANLDDAENCLKELMLNEEFVPYFIMEKLTS